jgi:hypothetical protein
VNKKFPDQKAADVDKIKIDEAGIIRYPDRYIDLAAKVGKADIAKKIGDNNTKILDQVDGAGTAYRESFTGSPEGMPPMMHGTSASTDFPSFRNRGLSGSFVNTTNNPAVAGAFTDSRTLQHYIAKEKNPAELQKQIEYWSEPDNLRTLTRDNPLDNTIQNKRRTIGPIAQSRGKMWDFRNPADVDAIIENMKKPTMSDLHQADDSLPLEDVTMGFQKLDDYVFNKNEYGEVEIELKEDLRRRIADGSFVDIESDMVTESAKDLGYDGGFVVEEKLSKTDEMTPSNMAHINEFTYNPKDIRIEGRAAFDPAKFNSKHMLGTQSTCWEKQQCQ